MPKLNAIIDQFVSFFGGPKLIVGQDLKLFAQYCLSAKAGIVAKAGGGQSGATPLPAYLNSVDTVANANDSVALPYAIPGTTVVVINNTANAMQVFGQLTNPNNGGAGDTIAIQGSISQVATGTGISQATGVKTEYFCTTAGQWQQGAIT